MGIGLAIKRSWRYFLPRSLQDVRRLVRQLYIPAVFYVIGFFAGTYHPARAPSDYALWRDPMTITFVALLLLKWWAGKSQPGDFLYQAEDGAWRACTGSTAQSAI